MVTKTSTSSLRKPETMTPSTGQVTQQDILWDQQPRTTSDVDRDGWLALVRFHVYRHPEVEELYVSVDTEPVIDYWIVIPHRDIDLVERIVEDQQRKIVRLFAGTSAPPFSLDFHICYREGRVARNLIPSNGMLIPRF